MAQVTIVSIYPVEVNEFKPGLYPGNFTIPAAPAGKVETLTIGDSIYYVYLDSDRPPLKQTVPAETVATSLISDYVHSLFGINEDSRPGLFWVPGVVSKELAPQTLKKELHAAQVAQLSWFKNLVALADDSWVATNKQHRAVSGLQRLAARALNLEREWLIESPADGPKFCFACKSPVHPDAIVCQNCRAILDADKFKTVKFAGA